MITTKEQKQDLYNSLVEENFIGSQRVVGGKKWIVIKKQDTPKDDDPEINIHTVVFRCEDGDSLYIFIYSNNQDEFYTLTRMADGSIVHGDEVIQKAEEKK